MEEKMMKKAKLNLGNELNDDEETIEENDDPDIIVFGKFNLKDYGFVVVQTNPGTSN